MNACKQLPLGVDSVDSVDYPAELDDPTIEQFFDGGLYIPQFLTKPQADELYEQMMSAPWFEDKKSGDAFGIPFGLSYTQSGGAHPNEIPEIPKYLKALADRVATHTGVPVNYVECHRFGATRPVRPHNDPKGMTVPMIVVGQERTFR